MKLVFVTVSVPVIKSLIACTGELKAEYNAEIELSVYYSISNLTKEKRQKLTEDIAAADLTVTDLMGSPPLICQAVEEGLKKTKGFVVPHGGVFREYLHLGTFTAAESMANTGKKPDMAAMRKMGAMMREKGETPGMPGRMMPEKMRDRMNYGWIMGYFSVADMDNIRQMLLLILSNYGHAEGLPAPKPPRTVPKAGICLPGGMHFLDSFEELTEKVPYEKGKPLALLLFYATTYPRDNSGWIDALMKRLQRAFYVLPVAMNGVEAVNDGTLEGILSGCPDPDIILNSMSFRFSAGPMGGDSRPGTNLLAAMDVPYLHPLSMTRSTRQEWEASVQGAKASEVMISIMLPEMDGAVCSMPVCARTETAAFDEYDITLDEMKLIEERADMLVRRAERLVALRKKPNADKKLAIMCYNYPPGEDNLFGGAFLDTLQSLSGILSALKNAGYHTEECPADKLKGIFLANRLVNLPKYGENGRQTPCWAKKEYAANLAEIPAAGEMEKAWGKAPGDYMTDDDGNLLLPGLALGNVWVGLQPFRGDPQDAEAYHDKTRPPHHQYVAYYRFLKDKFGADALIHVGTHGTLEFLKGKEAGMSGDCWPDILVDDLPHFYLYYAGNPAEGTIARRRSNAALVSYMPPVFSEGGLYDDYQKLEDLLQELERAERLYPASVPEIQSRIDSLAESLNLPQTNAERETVLYRMKHSLIPEGLHVFGTAYSAEEAEAYASRCETDDRQTLTENASKACEMESLLHALDGGYITPGLGGDIYRSFEVLPSGRNLYQFDQRLVPSPVALARGERIAEGTLERFRLTEDRIPESCAVILWGLETSRTQGETFAQILSYWGVRCVRQRMGGKSYEIIPLEELGRPRIDVTVNICGFFRDMFPTLIDEMTDLLDRLSSLDEPDTFNFIKAHTKKLYAYLIGQGFEEEEAGELSKIRIFGPEEGQYGTGLTGIIEGKTWETEENLGSQFLTSLRHAYNRNLHGRNVEGLYERNLETVDIVSQIRDNQEYELTDLDHYYEFFGGLSKSVEMVKGRKAAMYVTDTTGQEVVTGTANEAIQNGLRRRILNPKWRNALLAHDYHGAQKIAERFENIMGLAATTGAVDNWMYDDLHKTYVEDEEVREKMKKNNPFAYRTILEQMLEYYNRKYWDASEEQIDLIRKIYMELEDALEEES